MQLAIMQALEVKPVNAALLEWWAQCRPVSLTLERSSQSQGFLSHKEVAAVVRGLAETDLVSTALLLCQGADSRGRFCRGLGR